MKKIVWLIFFLSLIISNNKLLAGETKYQADVVERLGDKIPLDLSFTDSSGKKILLKNIINKPTIIDFCYYRCTGICTPLMVELADIVAKSDLKPGKDYDVLSISIDPNETPAMAMQKKNTIYLVVNKDMPDNAWRFFTGDSLSIAKLTDAAGFNYVKQRNGYLHKGVLIFVDKNGKICRYLQPGFSNRGGFSILNSDFKMAVMETSKGKVMATITKVLQTCFSFKPKGKDALVFSLVFFVGVITISTVLMIIKKANPSKGNRG